MQLGQLSPDDHDAPVESCSAYKAVGRNRKRGNIQSDDTCLSKSPFHMIEPCLPGDGQAPSYPWELGNEFFVLLCLCAQILL